MSFISLYFIIFIIIVQTVFFLVPLKWRNVVLVTASLFFLWINSKQAVAWFLLTVLTAWTYGIIVSKNSKMGNRKWLLAVVIILLLTPLCILKYLGIKGLLLPIGISFYTMSLLSYVIDVYRKKYEPEQRLGRFLLFASFFPQMVQGPIAGYDRLSKSLFQEHRFDYRQFSFGWQVILWGYFLKFVVADKAGIMVHTVFDNETAYPGLYIVFAILLYSLQLYADFNGCVCIATGVAQTFGITLQKNFNQPYYATSIGEFWRRWHMTLGEWLKEYIYIPLGGNRKGTFRKYLNVMIVFTVSGIWHGAGLTYLFWGMLQGAYQIAEALGGMIYQGNGAIDQTIKRVRTFLLTSLSWLLFLAKSLGHTASLVKSMLSVWNPEVILNGDLYYRMGLSRLQTLPLIFGICCMLGVDCLHERGYHLRERIALRPLAVRWVIFLSVLAIILVFGTYGPAYSANQFIYGQF